MEDATQAAEPTTGEAPDDIPANLDHFIVIANGCWGKDTSIMTAFWNWFKEARPKNDTILHIRQVAKSAYVDDMGGMTWVKRDGIVKLPDINLPKALIQKYQNVLYELEELFDPAEDKIDWDAMIRESGSNVSSEAIEAILAADDESKAGQ